MTLEKSVICALQHSEDPLAGGLVSVVSATPETTENKHGTPVYFQIMFIHFIFCMGVLPMRVLRACEGEKRVLGGMELL